jgi:2-aminoadipate transaminase
MINNLNDFLADNFKGMKRSPIRELLKLTQKPEIISFAGGLPSPESFPVEDIREVTIDVVNKEASFALQYGTTEGDPQLKKMIQEHYAQFDINVGIDNILITTASQQGLDLVGKIFVNKGDPVLVNLPSYLGGLNAFNSYGGNLIGIIGDEHGMRADKLEEKLIELKSKGLKPKFVYLVPDFQNPDGITMPTWRRKEILDLAYKYDFPIVEDSPYRELRFEGEHQESFYGLDKTGEHVILLGTFSKIFSPGFRIGWVLAHEAIIDKLVVGKQATDLCTSTFTQRIAARFIERGMLTKNIKKVIDMYRIKRNTMIKAFEEYMPEGVRWTNPQGGLFLFIYLPEYLDAEVLLKEAIERKVAFVLGVDFFCDGTGRNTARINFSYASKEDAIEGVKRLAGVIKEAIASKKPKELIK